MNEKFLVGDDDLGYVPNQARNKKEIVEIRTEIQAWKQKKESRKKEREEAKKKRENRQANARFIAAELDKRRLLETGTWVATHAK